MPVITNIPFIQFTDGAIVVNLTPPANVSQMSIMMKVSHRLGGPLTSGLYYAWMSSGNNAGASGLRVINGAEGIFGGPLPDSCLSGQDWGNYAVTVDRYDSGYVTRLVEGYVLAQP